MSFEIREIAAEDLPAVIDLLSEGFPAKDRAYWQDSIAALEQRPLVAPYPRYGYVLIADGAPQGVILLITTTVGGTARSNLSSWYVHPDHRNLASFLFQRSLKTKGGLYLNVSPAPQVMPIVKAFGFQPYTAGTYMLDPSAVFHSAKGRVRAFDTSAANALEDAAADVIKRHQAYGCTAITIEDTEGVMPALYRVRMVRGVVPVAGFVWGTPERLIRNRGALMRWLIGRGILAAFVDAPCGETETGVRLFREKGVRYRKGNGDVQVGDLRETELAVFGQ